MDTRVEAERGVVVVKDSEWSFDFDCRTGSATLAFPEGPLRLLPLTWRQKTTLARFASLGVRFVARQFLRECLEPGVAAPTDEPRSAALRALALWVNGLDGSHEFLPTEPGALARAALEIYRATGWRPGDLDDRAAAEVEQLWLSLRSEPPEAFESRPERHDPAGAGVTRINVIPDPRPPEALETQAENESADEPAAVPPDEQPKGSLQSVSGEPEGEEPRPAGVPARPQPRGAPVATSPPSREIEFPGAGPQPRETPQRGFRAVRVFQVETRPAVSETLRPQREEGSPPAPPTTPEGDAGGPASAEARTTKRPGVSGATRADRTTADNVPPAVLSPPSSAGPKSVAGLQPAPAVLSAPSRTAVIETKLASTPRRLQSARSQAPLSRETTEALFDEWADRLEQAAVEMGVLMEEV